MAGQQDLLKQAIELRKQRAAQLSQTLVVGEPEPAPVVEAVTESDPDLTPQQKILKQATAAKKKALAENPSKKKAAKKRAKKKARDPKAQAAKKAATAAAKKRAKKKAEKPVVEKKVKVEKPVRSTTAPTPTRAPQKKKKVGSTSTIQFTGQLTPASRAFAPTLRKVVLEDFGSVSVGTDRAIVRNPRGDSNPEQTIREKLSFVGINVARVEKIQASELNPDTSFRIFYG